MDFNVNVMIQVRPPGAIRKLQALGAGLFKVLAWIGPNAYVINLLGLAPPLI